MADTATPTAAPTRYLIGPEAYWSEDFFELEQRRLFAHTWHLVADLAELAEPGDFVTFSAGHDPLVVVRGLDGGLRCFHNICRHRGMLLLEGAGNTRPGISCPYHLWNWGLDGELRRIPQHEAQFCDVDLGDLPLVEGSVGTWGGMVFAHPDPGLDVADWLDGLPGLIGSFRPDELVQVARRPIEAGCNWKLFVENHVDVLHLWYLHARTLGDFDHHRFEWVQSGRSWASYEPLRDGIEDPRIATGAAPAIDHLDGRDLVGIGAHSAFPNVCMATTAEFFITYVARPVAPDRTVVDLRVRAAPGADAEALVAAAESFICEDIAGCEGVQAAVRSGRFAVGPLAQGHERPIMLFQQHLLDALGLAPSASPVRSPGTPVGLPGTVAPLTGAP